MNRLWISIVVSEFQFMIFSADSSATYRKESYLIVESYLDPYEKSEFTAEREREIREMKECLERLEAIYTQKIGVQTNWSYSFMSGWCNRTHVRKNTDIRN